jgi:hypothetical protein
MATTPQNLRDQVVSAFEATPDPRARELLTKLAKHLHDFVIETNLTVDEWLTAVEFLTAVGKMSDDKRQEFVLLSDVFGISALVDFLNGPHGDDATENALLGPFYVSDAPLLANGDSIVKQYEGDPVRLEGQVTGEGGKPLDRRAGRGVADRRQRRLRRPGPRHGRGQHAGAVPDRRGRPLLADDEPSLRLPGAHRRAGRATCSRCSIATRCGRPTSTFGSAPTATSRW